MTDLPIATTSSKVSRYGVDKRVLAYLENNLTYQQVAVNINHILNDPDRTVTGEDVEHWFLDQSDELQQEIMKKQYMRLSKSVFNMERRGIKVREEALKQIEELIESAMKDKDTMTTRDKNELTKMIMKRIYVQESGEKFAGVGSGKRNYGEVNVNINVDVIDRLKELNRGKDDNKDKVVDIEYTEVKEGKDKKKNKKKDE